MRSSVRTPYLLLALLVAAFVTLYPQLEAAGYCGDGSCPEVSHSAPASGPASGALVASGASFVVAVLVAIPTIARALAFRLALSAAPPALVGITLSPETPPPRFPI